MSAKVTSLVTGLRNVQNAFRGMNAGAQLRAKDAVRATTEAVWAGARARVPVSDAETSRKAKSRPGPGELRDTIRTTYSEDGLIGYVQAGYGKLKRRSRARTERGKARAARKRRNQPGGTYDLGVYAMVVEYGSPREHKAAQPYMRPARAAEYPKHLERLRAALAASVHDASQAGGG